MTDYYPTHHHAGLQPLTGAQHAAAWQAYRAACNQAYYRGPLDGTTHILWFLVGLVTFGLGWIGWLIHVCVGKPTLRPGMYAPVWPPPGYYVPR